MNNSTMQTGMKAIKTLYYFWHVQADDTTPIEQRIMEKYVFEETPKTYKVGWDEEWKEGSGMYLSTVKKAEMQTGTQGGFYFETYEEALQGLLDYLVKEIRRIESEVDRLQKAKSQFVNKHGRLNAFISKGGKV